MDFLTLNNDEVTFDTNIDMEILDQVVFSDSINLDEFDIYISKLDSTIQCVDPNEIQPDICFTNSKSKQKEIEKDVKEETDSSDDSEDEISNALSPQLYKQQDLEDVLRNFNFQLPIQPLNKDIKEEALEPKMTLRSVRCANKQPIDTVIKKSSNTIKKAKKQKSNSKDKKMKNCKHVWQFLRDELKCESENVEWIDQERGVFKIVKQTEIAQAWGKYKTRKSEKDMDYEKMSRGIRHSRKDGFFQFIDKDQSYGVKLVYQFGSKSIANCEWLNSFVNLDLD